jgi:hypothetical protein
MYAHKNSRGYFDDIHRDRRNVALYDKQQPIYEIDVTVNPDQSPAKTPYKQEYWGWLKTNDDCFSLVMPSYPQFAMCFTYGFKIEEEHGKGKAYRLLIQKVKGGN